MPHHSARPALAALALSALAVHAAAATDVIAIAVDPGGSDTANGDAATGPVRSLQRAQALARQHLAAMASGQAKRTAIRVQLAPGDYTLPATLTFTPADSGTAEAPVSYEAKQPGTAVLSGGLALAGQTAGRAGAAVIFSTPADASATAGGGQLFVNGRRAVLARQPNAGASWFVKAAAPLPGEPADRQGAEAFKPAPANLAWLRQLDAADRQRAIVQVYNAWTTGQHRIAAQPAPEDALRITPRAKWPFLSQGGVSQRYFVENVAAALDTGGEWLRDDRGVRYIARADDAGKTLKAVLPQLERLVVIQGERGKPVQHLRFAGLAFAHARHLVPAGGFVEDQAATAIGAAVEINQARHVVLEDCRVSATGGWGIWLRDSVRQSTVRRCALTDLGAGGIKVGLEKQSPADDDATGGNDITANHIDHTGRVYPGAPALWVGQSWDNRVTRNTIHDTTYTGISVGWSWGYAAPTSGRNLISGNLLYNIGQRQLADLGGIYTLGRAPGTVISNNIIRAVRGYPGYGAGAWGIYADEGSSELVVDGNVVVGTDGGGFRLHYGKDNRVTGNMFAQGGGQDEVQVERADADTKLQVEQNVLSPANAASPTAAPRWAGNTVRRPAGAACKGDCAPRASAQPLDIQADGPEAAIVSRAVAAWGGPDGNKARAALSPVVDAPIAALAPASDVTPDIAGTPPGSRPAGLTYEPKDQAAAISVEADASAPGGRCLALNDSDAFARRYEPFAFATLTYGDGGTTTSEFALKLDATAVLVHEWRDARRPYLTGPSLRIAAGGVTVNGQVIAPVRVDQWATYRITASGGRWSLEMLGGDGRRILRKDGLAFKDASWRELRWLGFIADGAVVGRSCLANIMARHRAP